MKTSFLAIAASALCLATVLAQAHSHEPGRDGYDRHDRAARHHCDYSDPWKHERNHQPHRRTGGAGPCHDIHRGEVLPRYYWHQRYDVANWRANDLPAPWRGHRWVRTGNDFALVDVRSGRIAKLILQRHRKAACRLHSKC
jgi:Ni/Co efflux regulator RcnB